MSTYKTPGVYVEETPNLPPSVVEVASAVPAFVGYTVKAVSAAPEDLRFKPTLVRSMLDFEEFFGDAGAEGAVVHLTDAAGLVTVVGIDDPPVYHPLYFAMRMFFENGGRRCYVVSVGARTAGSASTLELADLTKGVETLALEDEVTLLVVPEARSLPATDYKTLATIMLAQCAQLRDRFAIFDLPVIPSEPQADSAIAARACFPDDAALMYGAAYYPDLRTTLAFPYEIGRAHV